LQYQTLSVFSGENGKEIILENDETYWIVYNLF